jgi:hypothetical protein
LVWFGVFVWVFDNHLRSLNLTPSLHPSSRKETSGFTTRLEPSLTVCSGGSCPLPFLSRAISGHEFLGQTPHWSGYRRVLPRPDPPPGWSCHCHKSHLRYY